MLKLKFIFFSLESYDIIKNCIKIKCVWFSFIYMFICYIYMYVYNYIDMYFKLIRFMNLYKLLVNYRNDKI